MALCLPDPCGICMINFNESNRKDIILPCEHNFCLTCLLHLQASDSKTCPVCRKNWAHFEVHPLPGMEDLAFSHQIKTQSEDLKKIPAVQEKNAVCSEHNLSYWFWCDHCKEFACKKCVTVKQKTCDFKMICDSINIIKADLVNKHKVANNKSDGNLATLNSLHEKATKEFSNIRAFKDKFLKLEEDTSAYIQAIEIAVEKIKSDQKLSKEIDENIEKVSSEDHVSLIENCKEAIKKVTQEDNTPIPRHDTEAAVILCHIVSCYMEEMRSDRAASSDAFISNMQEKCSSKKEGAQETGSLQLAADSLVEGENWTVDSSNCLAAVCALAVRQPSLFSLVDRDDEPEPLPAVVVAAVAKSLSCCVWTVYLDSFYKSQDPSNDRKRLEYFLPNPSLRLTSFYGHLDALGVARLPRTIRWLGLAISSAADARAVSGLTVWKKLRQLHVAVNSSVAPQDLRPLPTFDRKGLHFYGLSDTDSVKPAIDALVPDKRFNELCFPKCRLTAGGATRLAGQLRGVEVDSLFITSSDVWQPGQEERDSIGTAFAEAGVCHKVCWNMDWLYR